MKPSFQLVTKKGRTVNINDNYEEIYMSEYKNHKKIQEAIDKLIMRSVKNIADNAIDAIKNDKNIFYIFQYNDNETNGKIYNNVINGISTKYLLSEEWHDIYKKFINKAPKPISQRIIDQLKTAKYNNGIDYVTKKNYKVSIFYYKRNTSKFDNGIMISRDGILYN